MITYKDFRTEPASGKHHKLSVYFGTHWVAYAETPAHASELISSFAQIYNSGYAAAQNNMRKALGLLP